MAYRLNWSGEQIAEALGYLANPVTEAHIEVQVRPGGRSAFETAYHEATGEAPPRPGTRGYSVLDPSSDKQGSQYRVYFLPRGTVPPHIATIAKRAGSGQQRVSRNELVNVMLTHGFRLGSADANQVRSTLSGAQLVAFERGFAAAEATGP